MARKPTRAQKVRLRLIPTAQALRERGAVLPSREDRAAVLPTAFELLERTPTSLLIQWLPIFAETAGGAFTVQGLLRDPGRRPRGGA